MSNEAKILGGIGIVTVVIIVVAAFFMSNSKPATTTTQVLSAEQQKNLVRENNHKKGAQEAKVTLVEFGDFQCPSCAAAHPIVAQLSDEYKDEVTFVYRQYPLPMHKNARTASFASEAAGAQGKFYEMHDKLFDGQKDWENSNNPMEHFEQYAKELNLDIEKFKADVESKKYESQVQQDINDGNAVGVSATPTFFLNGEKIVGGLPYDQFKAKIDQALQGS